MNRGVTPQCAKSKASAKSSLAPGRKAGGRGFSVAFVFRLNAFRGLHQDDSAGSRVESAGVAIPRVTWTQLWDSRCDGGIEEHDVAGLGEADFVAAADVSPHVNGVEDADINKGLDAHAVDTDALELDAAGESMDSRDSQIGLEIADDAGVDDWTRRGYDLERGAAAAGNAATGWYLCWSTGRRQQAWQTFPNVGSVSQPLGGVIVLFAISVVAYCASVLCGRRMNESVGAIDRAAAVAGTSRIRISLNPAFQVVVGLKAHVKVAIAKGEAVDDLG